METSINNKCKAFTSLEQSKQLAEILPIESADMHYVRKTHDFMGNPVDGEWSHPEYGNPNSKYAKYAVMNFTTYEKLPCWSLSALLQLFPHDDTHGVELNNYCGANDRVWFVRGNYGFTFIRIKDEPIDGLVELIFKLHELEML